MRSGNPVLGQNTFLDVGSGTLREHGAEGVMTLEGTINRTAILLVLVVVGALFTWGRYSGPESIPALWPFVIGGAITGLVLALATVFKKTWAPVTAPLYALAEGLFIGGLSAILDAQYPGIVVQAAGLTFTTAAAMLVIYRSGLIKPTQGFMRGVAAATLGIMLFYLANFVASFFGWSSTLLSFDNGSWLSIGFSLVVVGVAALNLILDFHAIESGVEAAAPKYMEWFGAFALVVTLVWLYVEMLRLLAKLQSRD